MTNALRFAGYAVLVAAACVAALPNNPVAVSEKLVDSWIDDIQWVNLAVVFLVTHKSQLYRSTNGGRTWINQMSKLTNGEDEPVAELTISPANPGHIFVTGNGDTSWFSKDQGRTFHESALEIRDVRLHPTRPNWLLASTMSKGCAHKGGETACYKELHYSQDFGKTWHHATDYIVQFDWAEPIGHKNKHGEHSSDHTIFATVHNKKHGNQEFGYWDKNINFVRTTNFFKSHSVLVKHGNRFIFGDMSYLFVAQVNPHKETEVTLQISRDNSTRMDFQPAILPVQLSEHSYTVLDTSEGSVFLHVNHRPFAENAETGHVYSSDWTGVLYDLSLPYNHRAGDGSCDFEKVEGLEGVYLANFIDVDDDRTRDAEDEEQRDRRRQHKGSGDNDREPRKTKTVITFDKGAIWSYLQAPKKDASGAPIECSGCHLNLHGVTDLYGPFYSSESATGIIMATGNVGHYLTTDPSQINTYLSRDAGYSWMEVRQGSHIYEFGDHGGLIVIADDENLTDEVLFSWDEGLTWTSLKISAEKFQIENIIIEPSSTSQQFVVYGSKGEAGVVIHLDFSGMHERTCHGHDAPDSPASDYETWTPSDGRLGGKCLMGHTVQYTRRKRASQCFNPEEHIRKVEKKHCQCTEQDYQCDYGYTREVEGGACLPVTDQQLKHKDPTKAAVCTDKQRITKGYRRVPGDSCIGGEQWDATSTPCPSAWIGGNHAGKSVIILLLLAVLALGVVMLSKKFDVVEDLMYRVRRFLHARSQYDLIGGGNGILDEQDGWTLGDEEFGQSAELLRDDQATAAIISGKDDGEEEMQGLGEFAPLPAAPARTQRVPVLDAPPSAEGNGNSNNNNADNEAGALQSIIDAL